MNGWMDEGMGDGWMGGWKEGGKEGRKGKVIKQESQCFNSCRISVTMIWVFTMGDFSVGFNFFLLQCWENKKDQRLEEVPKSRHFGSFIFLHFALLCWRWELGEAPSSYGGGGLV